MIEKITITQKQADAIRIYLADNENDKDELIDWFGVNRRYRNTVNEEYKPFMDLTYSELAKVVLNGYDVELQYKADDWVVHKDSGLVGELYVNEVGVLDVEFYEAQGMSFNPISFRHATEEEINNEQEIRLWKSINRAVGEFRDGDGFTYKNGVTNIVNTEDRIRTVKNMYLDGHLKGFYPIESYIEFKAGDNE